MAKSVEQIKADLLDILSKNRGGCLCTMRESCDNCDPYSSGNRLDKAIRNYLHTLEGGN